MHGHYLCKGLDHEVKLLEGLVREAWEEATTNRGYGAWRVEVAELMVPGAAIHYLGLHHKKAAQAPPDGWRGMLERSSAGYWSQPVPELRKLAQLELRAEALAWATTIGVDEALWLVTQDAEARAERRDERARLRDELSAMRREGLTTTAAVTVEAIEQLGLWS
jgi:hypothetical protein